MQKNGEEIEILVNKIPFYVSIANASFLSTLTARLRSPPTSPLAVSVLLLFPPYKLLFPKEGQ